MMSSRLASFVNTLVKNRKFLPSWANIYIEKIARNPNGFLGKTINFLLFSEGNYELTKVPNNKIRVYISPTNYAGQAYEWAHALEQLSPTIGANNLEIQIPGGYEFPTGGKVSLPTFNRSDEWSELEFNNAKLFTHVLVEAERSMFGTKFNQNLESEISALRSLDISVAFICHGTDIRDPELHGKLTPWSPYKEDPRTKFIKDDVKRNKALLEKLSLPVFVSTPDLLIDVPNAIWCPVVIDITKFHSQRQLFSEEIPLVVHVSSNPLQKGTLLITPILENLKREGLIDYQIVTNMKSSEIPSLFERADVVLDQFRSGTYGTAACEAMASGRVVIGHVVPEVRDLVKRNTGLSLPIVEANPSSLDEVLRAIATEPNKYSKVALQSEQYVRNVHSGKLSANQLFNHWIVKKH